ncbi:MAG: protein phosphatase 2C domain-containing protein [Stigonema ocellatum SAG 48.90 = DSM 106950]|nr:protein phosphatase 2C domain-containing protein [Stigonema ocellatum SAG 48.90 = DSM 106950]
MENDAATLYCPNENCQSPNPLTHNFCQQCRTPLPKRYLWVVGNGLVVENPGEILADRYLVINKSILLDTKPGLPAQTPELENLQTIRPYLRLIPYRLHIPQVYGVLTLTDGGSQPEILLLEKPPLNIDIDGTATSVHLCSKLTTAWREATSMRQLNWLWQIAQLWQPLTSEGVASSLLDQELLRVEGSLVRLLELQQDLHSAPELPQLGKFWQQQLLPTAKPAIAEFVSAICRSLGQGEIHSGEQLTTILDQGLAEIGQCQIPTIKIATKSDTGPSRQRNEDACYPQSGTTITKPPHATAIAIVCDGIGGHEGGNIASNLAIETIQQQVEHLTKISADHINPATLLEDLEQAAAVANDKISQINDSEHRSGRQRMGTTLVMALPIAHQMYIAHVGDSRAYWMTRYGCYQVTLDDDVASREVRLGYATYRDALQQGASGSLVQALGMSPSSSLHPTAQRFILDEDCVFLLCSDGLSDFDRVEQYWDTEILPIITDELDVVNVAQKLVEIANEKNGHDNVTIALVHYQVKYSEPQSTLTKALADLSSIEASPTPPRTTLGLQNPRSTQTTQVVPTSRTNKSLKVPLVSLAVVVLGGVLLGYLLLQHERVRELVSEVFQTPSATQQPSVATTPQPEPTPGQLFETKSEIKLKIVSNKTKPSETEATAPPGSILQIISIEPDEQKLEDSWVHLRVCSIGKGKGTTSATSKKPPLQPGDEANIILTAFTSSTSSAPKQGKVRPCQPNKTSPSTPKESTVPPTNPETTPEHGDQ